MPSCRAFVLSIALSTPVPLSTQQPADLTDHVDAVFARCDTDESAGCAAAITRDGRPVLARACGMADLEHGIDLRFDRVR